MLSITIPCFIVIHFCALLLLTDDSHGDNFQTRNFYKKHYEFDKGNLEIINGNFTNITAWPITVAFLISNDIWGAGAIYNRHWIVTTAYNCLWIEPKYMSVRAASSNWTEGGQLFGVEKCVMHPAYNAYSGENNVAMVRLRGKLIYGQAARAAFMPLVRNYTGRQLTVAGWGVRTKKYFKEKLLQASNQKVLTSAECSKKYNMTSTTICAYNATSSPCIFDFGAPLMSKRVLVALYSGSHNCTDPAENPSLYTEMFPYKDWMENVVKQY